MLEERGKKSKTPFHNAPDPYYFYYSRQHRHALDHLLTFLRHKKGTFLLTGEMGTGKTLLCRYLQEYYSSEFSMGLLFNPFLEPKEFERQVLRIFHVQETGEVYGDFTDPLTKCLSGYLSQGKIPVLIIDEAHLLNTSLFEHLLILSNLYQQGTSLLQVVLSGQPELGQILQSPKLASLNQRITGRVHLRNLSFSDTKCYVRHRLRLNSDIEPNIFRPSALRRIWKVTDGTPRLINQLCDRVLAVADMQKQKVIKGSDIGRNIREHSGLADLFAGRPKTVSNTWALGILGALLLVGSWSGELSRHSFSLQFFGPVNKQPVQLSKQTEMKDSNKKLVSALKALRDEVSSMKKEYAAMDKDTNKIGHVSEDIAEKESRKDDDSGNESYRADQNSSSKAREPHIRIGAIVWDQSVKGRFAVINDQILREGDSWQGIRIERIKKDRVVFSEQGSKFERRIQHSKK